MAKIRSLVSQGVRDEQDVRRDLWRSFVDVVLAIRPRAVLLENVPDMAIGDDVGVIREIADLLEADGYAVDYRLLDAWRFGVPQHRKRFFLQARSDGICPRWPKPTDSRPVVRDAIEDLPRLGNSTGARVLPYVGEPTSDLAKSLRGSCSPTQVLDHITRPVRDDDREAFQLMTPDTLYSDLPDHLRRYRSDTFDDKYKRLDWDDLSRTITAHIAKDGYWYIHPEEQRTLTVREAARLQTFPDCFRFAGTRSDAFRQIGNAVPPRLGRWVAESLAAREVDSGDAVALPALRQMLETWALQRRLDAWWLFPGPNMTPAAAFIATLLELHRMNPKLARPVATPFVGEQNLTLASLRHIDVAALSKTRKHAVRRLRETLRTNGSVCFSELADGHLGKAQRTQYSILLGGSDLFVNNHVANVVTLLLKLPEEQRGLGSDIKVALARLVASGPYAALRMCALRAISVAEARARFASGSSWCETSNGEVPSS